MNDYGRRIADMLLEAEEDGSDLSALAESLANQLDATRPARDQLSRPQQLDMLRRGYRDGRIVFVLGAGVSRAYGLPDWNTLLQKLLLTSIEQQTRQTRERATVLAKIFASLFLTNPLIAARYLSNYYRTTPGNEKTFEEAVRRTIYEEVDDTHQSELVKEIRRYCIAPGKSPSIDSIITYNYDDLIERALSEIDLDIRYSSIYDVGMNPSLGELPIYHVHGYLPRVGELGDQHRITLSEDYYHKQYSEIYSWNNIVQINKFRDNVCVFIGTSFTDPNLRRLLDIARAQRGTQGLQHFIFRKQYDRKALAARLKLLLGDSQDIVKDGALMDPSETIDHLIQIAETFEQDDDRSFGVSTIWLDEYAQIPGILADVRQSSFGIRRTRRS